MSLAEILIWQIHAGRSIHSDDVPTLVRLLSEIQKEIARGNVGAHAVGRGEADLEPIILKISDGSIAFGKSACTKNGPEEKPAGSIAEHRPWRAFPATRRMGHLAKLYNHAKWQQNNQCGKKLRPEEYGYDRGGQGCP